LKIPGEGIRRRKTMADFFVKLKEQVSAGITTVTTKSHVALETTRLRRQVRKLAQEKKEALAQLGARAYQEMGQRGQVNAEGMRDAVARIQELDRSMEELGKEMTRLAALDAATAWPAGGEEKPLATCTCGAPLYEGTKVCGTCGANAQEIVAKAAAALCPQCGAGISSSTKFCRSCGAALTERPEAPSQTEPRP
jgi:Double zinc ribbon